MVSYKDKERISRYITNMMVQNEDADYIGYFLNLTDEKKLSEINEMEEQ